MQEYLVLFDVGEGLNDGKKIEAENKQQALLKSKAILENGGWVEMDCDDEGIKFDDVVLVEVCAKDVRKLIVKEPFEE